MAEPGPATPAGEEPWPIDAALEGWREGTGHEDAPAEGTAPAGPRAVRDGGAVELVEVTAENVRAICRLVVAPDQRGLVAPNAVSLAEALVSPLAWYRAIAADGVLVGLVMLSDDPEGVDNDGTPEYYLWRLMIADGFQGRGYGAAAIGLLVDYVRTRPGATELLTSWVPGPGGPEAFYLGLGFQLTGEIDDDEVVARLRL